jgi:hypothetical protein
VLEGRIRVSLKINRSARIDRKRLLLEDSLMEKIIYPRSPREVMAGWVYLPRFVDKARLKLAGKLHADYQDNFTKGFDGAWLKKGRLSRFYPESRPG